MLKLKLLLQKFFQINLSFLLAIFLVRIFENFTVAIKFFNLKHPYIYEFLGLFYDLWTWFIYSAILLVFFSLIYFIKDKIAILFLHLANGLSMMFYFSFVVVFSERTMPFDHELFTRELSESISTAKTFVTSNLLYLLLLILAIAIYFCIYYLLINKKQIKDRLLYWGLALMLMASLGLKYAMPDSSWFSQTVSYYLTCNKAMYWAEDSYRYFTAVDAFAEKGSKADIEKEVDFYQKNQGFKFISKEYPLMHEDLSTDVLGGYFNLGKTPPNIVLLVVESLSNDFSGATARPVSFTPFLDSLSQQSLYWSNFLSCATGSFAVYPAMMGSLPYGKNGFSLMTVLPEHNSLIKILRNNGYYTTFMTGFDLDYYNMGSFMRQQGTDFILNTYGPKYKKMGLDSHGWTAGYPDEALFQRSFEVLDSVKKTPYLNTYFTLSMHEPYIFKESPIYEKLFHKKLKTLHLKPEERNALYTCKSFLRTVMYSDDCFRRFFAAYKKRKEYANTIFLITGDHHDGMYPTTELIDDYHVPLIIYSPMLKKPRKFQAINTHNNIGPTLLAMLNRNYKMPEIPSESHWFADVLDTCQHFHSKLNSPFMLYSREIENYIYEDNFLTNDGLFKIKPNFKLVACKDEKLREKVLKMRENYKYINSYVCSKNKICPADQAGKKAKRSLIYSYPSGADSLTNAKEQVFASPKFKEKIFLNNILISKKYKKINVELQMETYTDYTKPCNYPELKMAFKSTQNAKTDTLFISCKSLLDMTETGYKSKQWNTSKAADLFCIDTFNKKQDINISFGFYSFDLASKIKMKNFRLKIYGIE